MSALISLIWSLHLVFFLLWIVPFFIPKKHFKHKLRFQLRYMVLIIIINLAWGFFFLTKMGKYIFSCPLTTWMQYLRGYAVTDPLNYTHSFVAEFSQLIGIPVVPIKPIMFILLLIVIYQMHRQNL